jgi:FAD/FMN-containing dehydrogenase
MTSTRAQASVNELRQSLAGAVLTSEDADYDAARRCYNGLVDRRPAVIARCVSAADVATAFSFARTEGLDVAVRGGGHNPAGHCVVDEGLVIDLSSLRAVEVDAEASIARAGGGSTWLDFDSATQAFGLVTPGGVVGSTGVGGLTLGGGIGHLTSQLGLTCDNLVGAEVVTPDGSAHYASADENAELLWGLRGGGGNFGVATRLDFRLHPLDRVVGGLLTYSGDAVGDVLRRFRDLAAQSSPDASLQAILGLSESAEPVVILCLCSTSLDPGELRTMRSLPGLRDDDVRERSFLEQQRVFDSPYGVSREYWKGHFVAELPDELIDELVRSIGLLGRPPGQILIESLHGAPKDADPDGGVVGFRRATFNVSAMASWQDAGSDDEHIAWARGVVAAIEPWSMNGGGYVNYMTADEPIERLRAAFGAESFARLQALKRRYDPDNVLRRNQNIPPS